MILRRSVRALGWAGLALFLPVLCAAAHVSLASYNRQYSVVDVEAYPVALVLGAHAYPGSPSPFLAARLDVAKDLFDAGKVQVLLLSGDNRSQSNHETAVMKRYLVERGVPAHRIVEDQAGYDTYDSCVRARDVFGLSEGIVVTQGFHLDRAVTTCREAGLNMVGVAETRMRDAFPSAWGWGIRREMLANLKMEWDVRTGRPAEQQDPPSSAVTDALNS